MSKTVPMSFRMKPDLKAKLQSLADADRRSLTNYIEVILERHVNAKAANDLEAVAWDELRKPRGQK